MNFNIANLGSQAMAFMDTLDNYPEIVDLTTVKADDEKFAHVLRDESKRADQEKVEAKNRDAAEYNDRRDVEEGAARSTDDRPDIDKQVRHADTTQQRTDQRVVDENPGDDGSIEHDRIDDPSNNQPEDGQPEQRAENDTSTNETQEQAPGDTSDVEPIQDGQADKSLTEQNQQRQEAPGLQANVTAGESVAGALRMAAADSMIQPRTAETPVLLGAPDPIQKPQIVLPVDRDPLATGTLPIPLQSKPNAAMGQSKNTGTGTGMDNSNDNNLKLGLQIQTTIKQQTTPQLRGGQAMHGGDIMPDTLPRPQSGQGAMGNGFGRQLTDAIRSSANPAANIAGVAGSEGGAAIQNLQLAVSPERTIQAELPLLTVRPDGSSAPTSAVPQPLPGLPMEGEGKSGLMSLGDESGKTGGNSATSVGTASSTGASGSKAAAIIQQNATADVRSPGIQVAMHLSKAMQKGIDRMTISLDPAELGRVQVRLEVGHDGRAIAMVAAERPETLDLLQKDARSLERALQEAGLETDGNSLNFSLSHSDQQDGALADSSHNDGENGKGTGAGNSEINDETLAGEGDTLPQVVSNRALDISV